MARRVHRPPLSGPDSELGTTVAARHDSRPVFVIRWPDHECFDVMAAKIVVIDHADDRGTARAAGQFEFVSS
jgi:hypothetical protein